MKNPFLISLSMKQLVTLRIGAWSAYRKATTGKRGRLLDVYSEVDEAFRERLLCLINKSSGADIPSWQAIVGWSIQVKGVLDPVVIREVKEYPSHVKLVCEGEKGKMLEVSVQMVRSILVPLPI